MTLPELQSVGFKIYDYVPWVVKVSSDRESVQYLIIDIGRCNACPSSHFASEDSIKISGDVGYLLMQNSSIDHGNSTVTVPDTVTMTLNSKKLDGCCVVIDYDNSMFTVYN